MFVTGCNLMCVRDWLRPWVCERLFPECLCTRMWLCVRAWRHPRSCVSAPMAACAAVALCVLMMQCVFVTLVCVCVCVWMAVAKCTWRHRVWRCRWKGWGQCRIKRGLARKGLPNPILIRNGAAVSLNRDCTTADVLISSALWFTRRSPITQLLIGAYLSQVFSLLP